MTHQPEWIREQQAALGRYLRLIGAPADQVDDLTQEAFVVVLRRYGDQAPDDQVRLLRTIARNCFLRTRRQSLGASVAWSDAVDAWLAQSPDALGDGRIEEMRRCMAELTPRARDALTLRHVEKQPIEQVASLLGLRRSGALTLLQRSRDFLRRCLARRGMPAPRPDSRESRSS